MQYRSLQHQTLLPSPVISTTGHCFCFGSISSFFVELFLYSSPVAYWAPTDLESLSFSVISFAFSYCSWGSQGFPGGPVVKKNPPANGGGTRDTGSIPTKSLKKKMDFCGQVQDMLLTLKPTVDLGSEKSCNKQICLCSPPHPYLTTESFSYQYSYQ